MDFQRGIFYFVSAPKSDGALYNPLPPGCLRPPGTDAASPQLLVLPARLTVTLGGAGITALAPVASGVVAATGEGGRMEDAGPMG